MKRHTPILLMTACITFLTGCMFASCAEESDCSVAGRATIRASVMQTDAEGNTVTSSLEYLTVTALGTDSVLYNAGTNVTDVFLPLNYTADTTVWVLHYNSANLALDTDTIWIRHTNTPVFVSMDCGYDMTQAILNEEGAVQHTTYRLKSLNITSLSANTDGTKNMELLY